MTILASLLWPISVGHLCVNLWIEQQNRTFVSNFPLTRSNPRANLHKIKDKQKKKPYDFLLGAHHQFVTPKLITFT